MGNMCGSVGGWTRIGYLDMSDATQNCPSGSRYYNTGGVRACGRDTFRNGCSYQYGDTDPIDGVNNINANYLEGVSIMCGSPRQHVWSFLAGFTEGSTNRCPCATGSSVTVRSLMGNNFFVSLAIQTMAGAEPSTQLIHSGMVKTAILMKLLAAMVSRGFTETMVAPLALKVLS